MTYPAYHHLLTLASLPRHPQQGDSKPVRPVAIGAFLDERPAALALAEIPEHKATQAELLSVLVDGASRGRGLGRTLVERMEAELAALGTETVSAVYMTGSPGIPALEHIFERLRWDPPVGRAISVRFTPEEAMRTDWFGRVRLRDRDFEIFPWTAVLPEERAGLRASHEAQPWIQAGLEPWRHDHYGFDPVSSLGLRYRGTVVGWVINHAIGPRRVRFTCSFVRLDLSSRGRVLPLYSESIRRLADAGCEQCSLITPMWYKPMVEFLRRRCAHVVSFFGETRGVSKTLAPAGDRRS